MQPTFRLYQVLQQWGRCSITLTIAIPGLVFLSNPLQLFNISTPAAIAAQSPNIKKAEQLQASLDQTVKAEGMPGAVLLISTPQGEWSGASGFSDLQAGLPMKPTDRFSLASTSKTFVAVVVLQLAGMGEIDLDAPIVNYLPSDISSHIVNSDRITVRQLLNHTSGVAEYLNNDFNEATKTRSRDNPWKAKEAIQYIYDTQPQAQPGKRFIYTDTNYILLELIVENVTGNSLEKVVRSQILNPLVLNSTFTELREKIPGGLVNGYSKSDQDGLRQSYANRNLGNGLGDGGLVSTAHDLNVFLRALLAQKTLLSPVMMRKMLSFVDGGGGMKYGLGIQRLRGSALTGPWLGHSGSYSGFQSLMFYLPKRDITVVALTNGDDANVFKVAEAGLAVELGDLTVMRTED